MTNSDRNSSTPKDLRGALSGLKVLDASRLLPAALCTQLLGDLGADILKVEEAITSAASRQWARWIQAHSCYVTETSAA